MSGPRDGLAPTLPRTCVGAVDVLELPLVGPPAAVWPDRVGDFALTYDAGRRGEPEYLRARYYDPVTAQFLSRDPVVAVTRSPYGYVAGNPLNGADPSGLDANCELIPRPWDMGNSCMAEAMHTTTGKIVAVVGGAAFAAVACVAACPVIAGAAAVDGGGALLEEGLSAPKPPGFNPDTWDLGPASRDIPENHWWDPEGSEWRYHPPDKWHDTGHWDYNPWDQWNSPWQHLYPDDLSAMLLGGGPSCGL